MMKLIAIGTTDPNPSNWRAWDKVSLYIAKSKLEAVRTHYREIKDGDAKRNAKEAACEVDMSVSRHVMTSEDYFEN